MTDPWLTEQVFDNLTELLDYFSADHPSIAQRKEEFRLILVEINEEEDTTVRFTGKGIVINVHGEETELTYPLTETNIEIAAGTLWP